MPGAVSIQVLRERPRPGERLLGTGLEELTVGGSPGQPGLAQLDTRVLRYLRKLPPTPNVFPIELKTNMAAFVYFLIGMPAPWIMSATAAAAPGHSLHKQQLEKQDRGHCLGDFP